MVLTSFGCHNIPVSIIPDNIILSCFKQIASRQQAKKRKNGGATYRR